MTITSAISILIHVLHENRVSALHKTIDPPAEKQFLTPPVTETLKRVLQFMLRPVFNETNKNRKYSISFVQDCMQDTFFPLFNGIFDTVFISKISKHIFFFITLFKDIKI